MFNTVSRTGVGLIILILGIVFNFIGVDFDESQVTELANALVTIYGLVMLAYGQVRRKDLIAGLIRK